VSKARAFLEVQLLVKTLPVSIAEEPNFTGVVVTEDVKQEGAEEMSAQAGDAITHVNGRVVADLASLDKVLSSVQIDDLCKITLRRKETNEVLHVHLRVSLKAKDSASSLTKAQVTRLIRCSKGNVQSLGDIEFVTEFTAER
jgi:PDZ domain-containing secreted protein